MSVPLSKYVSRRPLRARLSGYCGTCRFFCDYEDGSNTGECRRFPPGRDDGSPDGIWPQVANFSFCGEYEYKPKGGE